jgi:phosphohistidine phosphatase
MHKWQGFDWLLCSPAIRTHTTAQLIASTMSIVPPEVVINPSIYHATENDLLTIVLNAPTNKKCIALVGHNPTISAFAKILTKSNIENFSPCTIAAFQFEIEKWTDLRPQEGRLDFIHFPSIF